MVYYMHNYNIVMIIKITVQYPLHVRSVNPSLDRKSENHWTLIPDRDVAIQLTYLAILLLLLITSSDDIQPSTLLSNQSPSGLIL